MTALDVILLGFAFVVLFLCIRYLINEYLTRDRTEEYEKMGIKISYFCETCGDHNSFRGKKCNSCGTTHKENSKKYFDRILNK